jgi:hypothetical protein
MVQIAEGVDRRDIEPGARRRVGGCPSRDARDQDRAWLRHAGGNTRRRHDRRLTWGRSSPMRRGVSTIAPPHNFFAQIDVWEEEYVARGRSVVRIRR